MIIKYTGYPNEPRHPAFKNEPTIWMPVVTVRLAKVHDAWTPRFGAVVDSGSPWCMFPTAWADYLRLDPSQGIESLIGGILKGATEPIFFHNVKIMVANQWCIKVKAGFTKKLIVSGILGRNGFFDNFRIRFDHSVKPPQFEIEKIELLQ
jgi:hypothetical protein